MAAIFFLAQLQERGNYKTDGGVKIYFSDEGCANKK